MTKPATKPLKPTVADLSTAFAALISYDRGYSRATLLPIDEAVIAALADKAARKELEGRLITALKNAGSVAAREFVCSKLAMIGTGSCVRSLAALLDTAEVATAARNALEAIPDRRAAEALRESLPKLQGLERIGAINSLGARRDADSVRTLSRLLNDSDVEIAGAAAAALGEIGSTRAAKALRKFRPESPVTLRRQWTDACLVCAERLLVVGKKADAETLYRLLPANAQPRHVQEAFARGLERASTQK
jgi:HEAT repeat protein